MANFGMIGTFTAHEGRGGELLEVLREAQVEMDGCELYVVGVAADDTDTVCVTELWRDADAHAASLQVPEVRAAIERAMPLIAGMSGSAYEPRFGIGADVGGPGSPAPSGD